MTQVSYPGVYLEEFTPGQPIEGVGTSTAAFVGTAAQGPVLTPVRLHNWEAFRDTFGDFVTDFPVSYLAPAVYGFFLNGGTDCYVLRAATAAHSHADLAALGGPAVLVATARQEGVDGDNIAVDVRRTSLLDDLLGAAGTTLPVHIGSTTLSQPLPANGPGRDVLTVADSTGFQVGDPILVEATNTTAQPGVVAGLTATTVRLVAPLDGNATFANHGSVRSANLRPGQLQIRVDLPAAGFRLDRALPRGALVAIQLGGGAPQVRTVATTAARGTLGTITIDTGLASEIDLGGGHPTVASLEFDVVVTKTGTTVREEFPFLAMNPEHPRYWGTAVSSDLITLAEPVPPPAGVPDDPRPAERLYQLGLGADDDRAAAWSGLVNDPTDELARLDPYGEIDLVCIPGATDAGVQAPLVGYCESRGDRFAILDATPTGVVEDQVDGVRGDSLGFAALYYPWIQARNPRTGRTELWPPSGHVAGVYARTDNRSGVHTAPANAALRGALGLQRLLSDTEQGPLNLAGVNVLRVFPGQSQPLVWGARTTTTRDRYWQYVNIRRLFLFLEKSIQLNLQWAVFQPNNLALWQRLRRVITDFLTKVWQDGALFGATAKEAFYVRIDEAINPESERALGRLHIEIGVAPSYPAEFVVVRIGIWQGGSSVAEG